MTSLLEGFEDGGPLVPALPQSKRMRGEPVKKARRLSPPTREPKPSGRDRRVEQEDTKPGFASSPPPMGGISPDDDQDYGSLDEDIVMNEVPIVPSSPAADAGKRRRRERDDDDDDDDDDLAVAQIKGSKGVRDQIVNISASRPSLVPDPPQKEITTSAKPVVIDSSVWTSVAEGLTITGSPTPDSSALGKLEAQDFVEEDGSIKMFWMDYSEVNSNLCLFGKVKDRKSGKYVSTFLKVDGIMRNLYFLPRETRFRRLPLTCLYGRVLIVQ